MRRERVHDRREPRNKLTEGVLSSPSPTTEQIGEMKAARQEFGRWAFAAAPFPP